VLLLLARVGWDTEDRLEIEGVEFNGPFGHSNRSLHHGLVDVLEQH